MNALTSAALLGTTSISTVGADTALITACAQHSVNLHTYNTQPGPMPDTDVCPLWRAYSDTRDAIGATPARTMAGVLAKARAIKAEVGTDDGDEALSGTPAEFWALDLVNELLAISAAPSPDTELLAACSEYLRMQWEFEEAYLALEGRDMEEDDPAWGILANLEAVRDKVALLPATTPDGFAARLRCKAFHFMPNHGACRDDSDAAEDRFESANLRDMVRQVRGVEGSGALTHPDAELLAAAAGYEAFQATQPRSSGQAAVHGTPECEVHEMAVEAYADRESALFSPMMAMPALTRAGLQAKARATRRWNSYEPHIEALLDDLLREPVA